MECKNRSCQASTSIKQAGDNRKFTVFIEKDNKTIISKEGTYSAIEGKVSFKVKDFWIARYFI